MGRLRTPTHILERRGAFKKNPARGRARAGSADIYLSVPQRKPFPLLPASFRVVDGPGSLKRSRLRDIWATIERETRCSHLHEDNFDKLDFVCELLLKCRHGRPMEDERALASGWLFAFRMPQTFAGNVTRT
jgi:hypothetical protein